MTFEEFKIALAAEVTNMVGEEVNVSLHKVQKNNGIVLDAISVMRTGTYSAPSIYLNDLYKYFKEGKSLCLLAQKVIEITEEQERPVNIPDDFYMDFEKIKNRICFRLVNYEKNRELLKEVPHERVMNLAKIYYYFVEPEIINNASILIRDVDLVRWGVSGKELKKCAEENTPIVHPCSLVKMRDMMEELMKEMEISDIFIDETEDSLQMYVLTNEAQFYGAACMLYPHVLESIAYHLDSHFYILPSSIHECIIIPDSGCYSQENLSQMVTDINEEHLDPLEVLADTAYYYDRNAKAIIS